jgi:transposase
MPGKPEASPGAAAPEEAASAGAEEPKPPEKRGAHRSRITGLENLPVETSEVIPDLVAADPDAFERIGEEVTELLDIVPARFFKRHIVRPKFRRKTRCHLPPIVAPAPVTPLVGGLPAAGLLAHLLVGKYVDHLPLYRQEKIFLRHGVGIPRDLIVHWLHKSINLLEPVALATRAETLASSYLQIDETPVRYLVPGSGKASRGYMWIASDPQGSLFYHWGVGRGCEKLIETIGKDFSGDIQCDGYVVYKTYAKTNALVKLLACLAHIRRNFVEVLDAGPDPDAAQILSLIGELYSIEADLRAAGATPTHRHTERAQRSAAIVGRIREVMEATQARHRPQSLMGKALFYGLGHWACLARYLEDGRFEIDNNLAENAVRPLKLGAKNWLFFGSEHAGHNAAVIYTLVENCRRHGIPVEEYLCELLTRLPGETDPETIASLTPARIAAARRKKSDAA